MRQFFPSLKMQGIPPLREYAHPFASVTQEGSSAAQVQIPCAASGQITNVRIKLSLALTSPSTFSIAGLDVSIPAGQTDITSAGSVAVTAGDLIHIRLPGNGFDGQTRLIQYSYEFIGTNSNEAILGGGIWTSDAIGNGDDGYLFLFGDGLINATEAKRRFYCPHAGTIKSFYVKFSAVSGGTGTRAISIVKNGVIEAATTLTFAAGDDAKSVTGLNIPFVPGDSISIAHFVTGTVNDIKPSWGIMYNPATDGESMIGGMSDEALSNTLGVSEYGVLCGFLSAGSNNALTTTESERQTVAGFGAFDIRKFRVDLESAPGASQIRRFRIRKNTANGSKVLEIGGTDTSGSDDVNLQNVADGDVLNISHEVVTGGVNNTPTSRWSMVIYVDPAGGAGGIGGLSTETLPTFNPSVVTALKMVQQGAVFPKFVLGAQGGSGGTDYGLYKKGDTYNQHLWRSPVYSIGRRFNVERVVLRFGAAIGDDMNITPRLYFDNESSSQNGFEITNINFPATSDDPNGVRKVVLTPESFNKNTEGRNNFFLELQWTGSVLLPVIMPISIEVEIYDNPND